MNTTFKELPLRADVQAKGPAIAWVPGVYRLNRADWRAAYGAGAQIRLAPVVIRLEYERVSEAGGDPDLLSLGITWSF